MSETTIITPEGWIMWPTFHEARGNAKRPTQAKKFSAVIVFPQGIDMTTMLAAATQAGRDKFGEKFESLKATFRNPVFKTTASYEKLAGIPKFAGCYYISASSNEDQKPGFVGPDLNPLFDKSAVYSGMKGRLQVRFYGYDNESKGISAWLCNGMKSADDERLGSAAQTAEQAFKPVAAAGAPAAPAASAFAGL